MQTSNFSRRGSWKARRVALPLANGDKVKRCTEAEPALSPKIVTLPGSPPNREMWACTHFRAITWSLRPRLPGASAASKFKNPGGEKADERTRRRTNVRFHCRLDKISKATTDAAISGTVIIFIEIPASVGDKPSEKRKASCKSDRRADACVPNTPSR